MDGGWLLNGAKTWCTFAGKAGVLMVVARTDPDRSLGHKGLSVLLAEKPSFDTHGFEVAQLVAARSRAGAIPTIGYRGMHSFDLSFQDFRARRQPGRRRGRPGQRFYYTLAGMVGGRMQISARACGVMRAALRAVSATRRTARSSARRWPTSRSPRPSWPAWARGWRPAAACLHRGRRR